MNMGDKNTNECEEGKSSDEKSVLNQPNLMPPTPSGFNGFSIKIESDTATNRKKQNPNPASENRKIKNPEIKVKNFPPKRGNPNQPSKKNHPQNFTQGISRRRHRFH